MTADPTTRPAVWAWRRVRLCAAHGNVGMRSIKPANTGFWTRMSGRWSARSLHLHAVRSQSRVNRRLNCKPQAWRVCGLSFPLRRRKADSLVAGPGDYGLSIFPERSGHQETGKSHRREGSERGARIFLHKVPYVSHHISNAMSSDIFCS